MQRLIRNLILDFTIENAKKFFYNSIKNLDPVKENLDHLIKEDEYNKFSNLVKLGEANLENSDELIVFACKYSGVLTERSAKKQQYDIAKRVLKDDWKEGAIFIFYDEEGSFRFSFIRRYYGSNEKYTNWKRYTYFVEPNGGNATFRQRIGLCDFSSLDKIQEAFSVEALTKEFYNELFSWFQWVLDEKTKVTFPNVPVGSEIKKEEQIIRLITRILFVWFIKQKELVPANLFDPHFLKGILFDFDSESLEEGDYYNAILQNLFFATLNKPVTEREFAKIQGRQDIKTLYRYSEMFSITQEEVLQLFRPIPFLNGGLFECLDREMPNGDRVSYDGFSRNNSIKDGVYKHRVFIPNAVFFDKEKGLFSLLNHYNFTVNENEPNEVQVALDPELLGNVFENLLGYYNPETRVSARKKSGSFYTPRDIVSYMTSESLIAYLKEKCCDIEENQIRELIGEDDLPDYFIHNSNSRADIVHKLKAIKILDPACGSGAFPMGILNKIVNVLEKLDYHNEKSVYDQKLHIIEECIYGVDIQPIAIQICKLRFFISLICEEGHLDLNRLEDNYGIMTLPNLETKFVAANTLIGLKKKAQQLAIFEDSEIDNLKEALLKVRKQHFYAKSVHRKKQLREKDKSLRKKLKDLLKESDLHTPEDANIISQWNPYDQNAFSPFFDKEWMFGLNEGFDLVIGNPPYINIEKIDSEIKKRKKDFTTAYMKYDLYVLFYEKGLSLLKKKGILSYITSNKYLAQKYGLKLRQLLLEKKIDLIVNFNYDIFDSATVRTCILQITNKKAAKNLIRTIDVKNKKYNKLFTNRIYSTIDQNIFNKTELNNFRINLTKEKSDLLNNIENQSLKVEDICDVNYGLRPVSKREGVKKDYFIKENYEYGYKKYFEGKDTGKWIVKSNRYLNYDINDLYNAQFPELFETPKLVGLCTLSDINKLRFIFDSNNMYCNHSVAILTLRKTINSAPLCYSLTSYEYSYYYLQGVLNSEVIKFYFNELMYDGTHFYPNHMKALPIKKATPVKQEPIEKVVKHIISLSFLIKEGLSKELEEKAKEVIKLLEELNNLLVCEVYFDDKFRDKNIFLGKIVNEIFLHIEIDKQTNNLIDMIYQNLNNKTIKECIFQIKKKLQPLLSILRSIY